MTYAAEPYEHITNHLLTALTGGRAREAHRFFAAGNMFAFGMPGDRILTDTVTVTGLADSSFRAFVPNRDFEITPERRLLFRRDDDDPALPASGACWPDEGSRFFVSYYHDESDRAPLTDRHVGSLNRTLAEAFAREVAVLRKEMEFIYRSGFVGTAEGSSLDRVVELLGLTRKSSRHAAGRVRFFRTTPAPADIFIPQGSRVSTAVNPPVTFVTCEDATLARGQLALEVEIRAEHPGPDGVVDAGTITVVNRAILGIAGVSNSAPTVFGGSRETDAQLRGRARRVMERVGRATPGALLSGLCEIGGLRENDIHLEENPALRPGVVRIHIADSGEPELAARVDQAIVDNRPAGIRVEHTLSSAPAGTVPPAATEGETRDSGLSTPEADSGDDGFTLPLFCTLVVFPENPRITPAEKNRMSGELEKAIHSLVDDLGIGGVLIYNRLVSSSMAVEGIRDVDCVIRAGNDTDGKGRRNISLPSGRKGVLADTDLHINFAGAPLYVDCTIRLTPAAGSGKHAVVERIRELLGEVLAAASGVIRHNDLTGALTGEDLFTLAADGLEWSVEYEQAGLLVRRSREDSGEITIPAGDRAELRRVLVEEV